MGKQLVSFQKGAELLKRHDIPVADYRTVKNIEEAKKASEGLGFPLTIKIDSPDIIHKSDQGCVRTNIQNKNQLEKAFKEIKENAGNAEIRDYVIQEQCQGTELILGGDTDPQFGQIILFGIGGIFVEILKDVSIRITPINEKIAKEMIKEIQAFPLLEGVREKEPVDLKTLAKAIISLSELHEAEKDIKEIDLNPVFGNKNGVKVADIRMLRNEPRKNI